MSGLEAVTPLLLSVAALGSPATIGFFDPYAPFQSPLERAEFAEGLAERMAEPGSDDVVGEAYSKAADLARDLASGRVQMALVHPQFLMSTERDLRPVLSGTRKGTAYCPYALFVAEKSGAKNLGDLRGRRLAVVKIGNADERFIYNAVLQGEIRNPEFFKDTVFVPDSAGAAGTLKFARAEGFFGPDVDYRKVFRSRAIRRAAYVGSVLCSVVVVADDMSPREQDLVVERFTRAAPRLRPMLQRLGMDGLSKVPAGALARLQDALESEQEAFGRARPLFVLPNEPTEKSVFQRIRRSGSKLLPEATQLVVDRDGL